MPRPPVTLEIVLALRGLRAPLPLPGRRGDDALDVRARLRRRRLEGVRERRGCGPLRRRVRPRGPGRARAAGAVARHVPAADVVERSAGASASRRARRAAKPRGWLRSPRESWPVLDERAPLRAQRAAAGAAEVPRSAWVLTGLAFLCGGLVSAAVFSIGWRHQAQRNTAAQSALAAARRTGAQARAEDQRVADPLGEARGAAASAHAAAAATARREVSPARERTSPKRRRLGRERRSDRFGRRRAHRRRHPDRRRAEDARHVSHDDARGPARSRVHREPDRVSRAAAVAAAGRRRATR